MSGRDVVVSGSEPRFLVVFSLLASRSATPCRFPALPFLPASTSASGSGTRSPDLVAGAHWRFLPRVAPSVEHEQRRCFNVRRLHVTFVYISCHSLFHYTLYRCRQPGNIITSHKDTPLDFSLTSHQSTIATIVRVYLEKIMCVYNNVNVKTLH